MALTLDLREGYAVALLRWNDPACLLDARTANDLVTSVDIAEETGCRALVLAAEGQAFCLGDTGEAADVAGRSPGGLAAAALAACVIPTIAVLDGPAFEAGLELALACDLRVASHQARLRAAHLQQGGFPQAGGTQRLPRLAGRARALQLLLLGEELSAREAVDAGLVQRLTAPGEALRQAEAWARQLAAGAPIAAQYLKEAVLRGMEQPLAEGLQQEADLYALLQTTHDRDEGLRAFREKRRPRFEGR